MNKNRENKKLIILTQFTILLVLFSFVSEIVALQRIVIQIKIQCVQIYIYT